ncbi:hypothetical protein AB0N62_42585 [Streptomyces sp. NPDC093982]|uniref:hypothetical protein n=1 Tax=Streptomyces sp. NPDC093982 TaxID=3155077 RepID=UPI003430681A
MEPHGDRRADRVEAEGESVLGVRAAVVCSGADQGVAALTNILVLVVAARLSTAEGFAAFSVVYTVFTVLLGLSASYVGQALVLVRGGTAEVRGACRNALIFTATVSTVVGAVMAVGLAALPGGTARGLTVLGLVLPVVLTQDSMRYCFATLRLPHYALAVDVVRLTAVLPALAAQSNSANPARLVAAWGLSALPALLTGAMLLAPRLRGLRAKPRQLLRRDHLGRRFAVEFTVGNALSQLAIIGLGLIASQLVVGALRGAITLFGPMNVLFNAATAFGPPILRRAPTAARQARATAILAVVLAGVAGTWTVLLIALPERAGRQLLGETWSSSVALLPATGSQYTAMAAGTCALLTLRLLRPRATLPIQVVFSLLSVAFLLTGYALGGVIGAAWGLCLGSALKACAAWTRIAFVRRETRSPAPQRVASMSGDDHP